MIKKSIAVWILMILLTGAILSGCDSAVEETPEEDTEAVIQTSVAGTLAALAEIESATAAAIVPTDTPTPTETSTPTVTLTPTVTMTPTPEFPRVSVEIDTNCRSGPGEVYGILGALRVGEEAEIVARFDEGDYWVIKNPDQPGQCWLWGYYATVTGDVDSLPVYTRPPTPTVTPTPAVLWTGSWTTFIQDPVEREEGFWVFTVTVNQTNNTASGTAVGSEESWGTIQMSGALSADQTTWSGTWQSADESGAFLWHWINPNQFNGNMGGDLYWCGFREGAGRPTPCMYP